MRRLALTAEDMRDLIAGSTINAMVEGGEELITSADAPSGWPGAVLSAVSEWSDDEFYSAFGFTRQEASGGHDDEPMRLNDDGPDFDGHQPLTTENWVERAKAVERGESTEGLVIALTGPNSVTSGSAPEPVVTKVVRLMNGDKIIGQVEVYADPGTDPIQVAATALKGGFTAAEVDGERFTLDELDEWWA